MAIKTYDDMYECSICHTKYNNVSRADACRENHDILYIPFTKEELNRLMMFIQLGDASLLPTTLFDKFDKYAKQSNRT